LGYFVFSVDRAHIFQEEGGFIAGVPNLGDQLKKADLNACLKLN